MKEIRVNTYKLKQDVAKLENLQQTFTTEFPEQETEGKGKTPEQVRAAEEKLNTTSNCLKYLIFETISVLKTVEEGMEETDQTAARAFESTQ